MSSIYFFILKEEIQKGEAPKRVRANQIYKACADKVRESALPTVPTASNIRHHLRQRPLRMAVAAATFWFTASTGTSRYSLTSQRLFSTCRRRQSVSFVPKFNAIKNAGNHQHNRRTSKKSPSFICKSDDEVMFKP